MITREQAVKKLNVSPEIASLLGAESVNVLADGWVRVTDQVGGVAEGRDLAQALFALITCPWPPIKV